MGAWDIGSFDNDAALDFAADINGIGDLTQAFDALGEEGSYADADAASEAVAAADLVAAMMGRPAPDMPDNLAELVAGFGPPGDGLIAAAVDAVRHVAAHSELAELWAEAEDEDWAGAMEELLTRLDPKVPYDPPPQDDAPEGVISSICLLCEGSIPEAEEVTVTMEGDGDMAGISFTLYAHRDCLEQKFEPPHFTEDGRPHPDLLAQVKAHLDSLG